MEINNTKKRMTTTAIVGVIAYFVVAFYMLHISAVMELKKLDFFGAFGDGATHMFTSPFSVFPITSHAMKVVMLYTLVFVMLLLFVFVSQRLKKHDDLKTIGGDAKWMDRKELEQYNKERSEPLGDKKASGYNNAIVSNDIFLSMNAEKTNCTLNILIIGGTGTGKSFRVIGPNILQRNCSMIITDPSGGLLKGYGTYLEYYGYRVKSFNLSNMDQSNHYNPFNYIHSDKDVEILVNTLITNTTDPSKSGGDEFWTKSETALLCALISYLYNFRPKEEQTFSMVKNMINAGNIDENNSATQSPLDLIFEKLRQDHPDCFAMAQYDTFRLAAGKTLKSILISCGVRLQAFDLQDVRDLTDSDDIHLDYIGDEKTAIFVVIPTGDNTFNFLAGLMYSQLFTGLYTYCETNAEYGYLVLDSDGEVVKTFRANGKKDEAIAKARAEAFIESAQHAVVLHNSKYDMGKEGGKQKEFWEIRADEGKGQMLGFRGTQKLAEEALSKLRKGSVIQNSEQSNHGQRCPIHVRFLLDEFSNTGKIPTFTQKLSTIRKYEISTTIILQSLKQLENLYEKEWDVITGNCDTTAYLGGGADEKTCEWIVKLLGKKTVKNMNMTFSKNGGSESIQNQSLELISVSQLRTLPKNKCVVIPRSVNPVFGDMYDTPHHPEWKIKEDLPSYEYSKNKFSYIETGLKEVVSESDSEDMSYVEKDVLPEESKADKLYRNAQNIQAKQKAEEVRKNVDVDGERKISDITYVDVLNSDSDISQIVKEALDISDRTDDASSERVPEDQLAQMVEFVYGEEMAFSVKPMME